MNKIKKSLSLLIFLLGIGMFAYFVWPRLKDKPANEKVNNIIANILGEKVTQEKEANQDSDILGQAKDFTTNITSEEFIQETTQKINQIVEEKVTELKEVPQKQLETYKKEVKKDIYDNICQGWLKKELLDE